MRTALAVLLLGLILLASCAPMPRSSVAVEELREQSFVEDLVAENGRLRAENTELRGIVLTHEEALARQDEALGEYLERLRAERNAARPYARIPLEDVRVYSTGVLINVSGAVPVLLADTHSMEPLADNESKIIAIVPQDERDIHLGDIIGYSCDACEGSVILHRVVALGRDANGAFYIVQGDNNPEPDPGKVRFSQIRTVVVGIIY